MYCLSILLKGGGVTSGNFNYAKRQFILNYGVRCKVCVLCHDVCHLSLETIHTHPPQIRFLGRFLVHPFCFKLFLKGCLTDTSC